MKKMVLIIMAVCMIATLGIATAQADSFICIVKKAGVGGGSGYVNLTDTAGTPAFENRWFTLTQTVYKEQLATALTAAANGSTVQVIFPGTGTPAAYAGVGSIYLVQ